MVDLKEFTYMLDAAEHLRGIERNFSGYRPKSENAKNLFLPFTALPPHCKQHNQQDTHFLQREAQLT